MILPIPTDTHMVTEIDQNPLSKRQTDMRVLIAEAAVGEAREARSNLIALLLGLRERSNYLVALTVGTAAVFLGLATSTSSADDSSGLALLLIAGLVSTVATVLAAYSASAPQKLQPVNSSTGLMGQYEKYRKQDGDPFAAERVLAQLAAEIEQNNRLIRDAISHTETYTMWTSYLLYPASLALWSLALIL